MKQNILPSQIHSDSWTDESENKFSPLEEKNLVFHCCVYRKCLGSQTTEAISWVHYYIETLALSPGLSPDVESEETDLTSEPQFSCL